MSQRAVEGLLGRLVTDEAFRDWFERDPVAASREAAFDVTRRELEAILKLEVGLLDEVAKRLDARIVRARINGYQEGARDREGGATFGANRLVGEHLRRPKQRRVR